MLYVRVFCLHVCLRTTYVPGAWRGRRGHWMPWSGSYRQLGVVRWKLGIKPGPFIREPVLLTGWCICIVLFICSHHTVTGVGWAGMLVWQGCMLVWQAACRCGSAKCWCRMGRHIGVSGHTLVCLAARWCDSVACRCGRLHVGVGRACGCGRLHAWHEVGANCLRRAHGSRDLDYSHFICHLLFLLVVLSTQDRRFWVYGHLLVCGRCCLHRVRD